MFERYTEKARRVIFFARYEASQYGSREINTEHLLLGLMRENPLDRWLPQLDRENICQRIDEHLAKATPTSTAVDLPLSAAARCVLKYPADEAERLANKHIGVEHIFLGLLDENKCFAGDLLREGGADAPTVRIHFAKQSESPKPWTFQPGSYHEKGFRMLSRETVEIHGSRWNIDYVRDVVNLANSYNWHWHKAPWTSRNVVIERATGRVSSDSRLAADSDNFELAEGGWKKD